MSSSQHRLLHQEHHADARAFAQAEVKRHRQGLKRDELSSSDVLDVTVFNLGTLPVNLSNDRQNPGCCASS